MNRLTIIPVKTPALGDTSYLVSDGAAAFVVDPQRDIDRYARAIDDLGVDLSAVMETHVHNDYVSGGPTLARGADARMIVPAGAAPRYRSEPAFHREPLTIGGMTVTPIHTPGHTPEHMSYVLSFEGSDVAVFSGGSLLIGAAGRSDLLGEDRAETLARLQFGSLRRLSRLDGHVELHPTHGPGSFCAASTGGTDSSTIAREIATNPVLQIDDPDEFVRDQLSGLPSYPAYYRYMAPINIDGGQPMPATASRLEPQRVHDAMETATIVDTRDRMAFAAGHIPGSLWVGAGDSFSSWVGWLTEINDEIVLVADSDAVARELQVELARIGYDNVVGWLVGTESWVESGGAVETLDLVTVGEWRSISPGQVLDVRDEWERDSQRLDGAHEVFLPEIERSTTAQLQRDQPVGVVCQSGYRATIAGSLLARIGFDPIVLADAGVPELVGSQLD